MLEVPDNRQDDENLARLAFERLQVVDQREQEVRFEDYIEDQEISKFLFFTLAFLVTADGMDVSVYDQIGRDSEEEHAPESDEVLNDEPMGMLFLKMLNFLEDLELEILGTPTRSDNEVDMNEEEVDEFLGDDRWFQ